MSQCTCIKTCIIPSLNPTFLTVFQFGEVFPKTNYPVSSLLKNNVCEFRTCARVRPFGFQILGESFYCQEHTKPLFSHLGLLTIQNLYSYHCLMEIFKILKFRAPISLHSLYTISQRKTTTLITPHPTNSFIYKSANMWNTLQSKLKIMDYSINLSKIKIEIKKLLLTNQVRHDDTEWYCSNFDLKAIGKPSTNFQI